MYIWHKAKNNEFWFQKYRNSLEVPDINLLNRKSLPRAFMDCQMNSLFIHQSIIKLWSRIPRKVFIWWNIWNKSEVLVWGSGWDIDSSRLFARPGTKTKEARLYPAWDHVHWHRLPRNHPQWLDTNPQFEPSVSDW